MAVEVHQSSLLTLSQWDISFDLSFTAFSYHPNVRLSIEAIGTDVAVRWPDNLAGWQLQQSADLQTWNDVTELPMAINGFFTVTLPTTAQQFFRLRQRSP